ncbi:antitoxin VbhA family protein [Mycobacteroides abscessus]|uniref:antitoxin VbhA family protein n=1 Tax=Mycobacteroides abscessus TaxID=36809 RepID=UPI000940A1D1|nr:antitoxin VbhA family protein [Mycobacteroides abscessus]
MNPDRRLSDDDIERAIDEAEANSRMDGHGPTPPATKADLRRVARGEMSNAEYMRRVVQRAQAAPPAPERPPHPNPDVQALRDGEITQDEYVRRVLARARGEIADRSAEG